MRLLQTETLTFEEFFETNLPRYAILSHRWGQSEVTYKDMAKKRAKEGPGLTKVQDFCKLAFSEGYDWVWIDTCCIDKKSSAEVSEAVNAMYRWYQKADKCYAYLFDVIANQPETFRRSSWFTRGWTLQELIAPMDVLFYDAEWLKIGSKSTLAYGVAEATGIDIKTLRDPSSIAIPAACIARKMYWASARQTSVPEDKAYCLLGLFDTNMPLLYGEGIKKAFVRLQKELLSTTTDETIFAWTLKKWSPSGLLASDPGDLSASKNVRKTSLFGKPLRPPWVMTNIGFQFTLLPGTWAYVTRDSSPNMPVTILVKLRCVHIDTGTPCVLVLSKVHHTGGRWRRIRHDQLNLDFPINAEPKAQTIYIVP